MSSNNIDKFEIRSEEVQEIISHIPSGLIRWGLTVIFFVIISLLGVTWFIGYPDLLNAPVVITTSPAPVNLVARTGGQITLLKQDNQTCKEDELLAFIQSNAEVSAVLDLEKKLLTEDKDIISIGPLGDLQPYFSALINSQMAASLFNQLDFYDKQVVLLRRQLKTYKELNNSLWSQQKLTKQELQLALVKFQTDSLLFNQKVTAAMDFSQSKSTWLQQQRSAKNIETTIFNNELQVHQLEKQVAELLLQKEEQKQKLSMAVANAKDELTSQIKKWKETYLLIATGEGNVAHFGFLENNMFIDAGRSLFSIIPNKGKLTARAKLPINGSGKVKVGQNVNIRLDNYPFEQFGMLHGRIESISEIPNENKYFLTIELPEKLITSQHKLIDFKQQLSGTTEIITEDLRLLERFFYQIIALTKQKNKST